MTLEEFKSQVRAILVKQIDDAEYIDKLDDNINKTFEEAKQLRDILGYDTPSPSGYALGISLLYPDLP